MTAAAWPTLGIPPVAVPAWRALTASLEARESLGVWAGTDRTKQSPSEVAS